MSTPRPWSLRIAVAALALLGLGGVAASGVLVAEGSGAAAQDDHLGGLGFVVVLLAPALLVVAAVAVGCALALWARVPGSWAAAAVTAGTVAVTCLPGVVIELREPALQVASAVGLIALVASVWPTTRRALRA